MQPVVCGVDMTDGSEHVAEVAAALAGRLQAPLVLATVVSSQAAPLGTAAGDASALTPVATPGLPYPVIPDDGSAVEATRADIEERLGRFAERLGARDARVRVHFGLHDADELRAIASEEDAALLVIGAARRGTLGAALLGSTAHSLCSDAPCPVVVVPPQRAEQER